jgi:hypothetical protein
VTLDQWRTRTELEVLLFSPRRRVSEREYRLLSVALCRRAHDSMADECSRRAVEMAERFADGLVAADELAAAWEGVALGRIIGVGGASFNPDSAPAPHKAHCQCRNATAASRSSDSQPGSIHTSQ